MARSELEVILKVIDKGSRDLNKFTKAFGAMAVAAGAAKIAGEAWQAAIAGAQMEKAEKSFASMAKGVGQDIRQISDAMIEASGDALSMQETMELASQAIRLGVAKTPEEFAKLTRAATNLGAAMGRGPVEAMQDIVRGIGRMSPLILDNIGIMTNGGKVFEDYAASVGKSAKDLTDAEKKQVLLNKAIEDGNALVDAASTGFERLDAAVKDTTDAFKKELGRALEPIAGELAEILAASNDLNEALVEVGFTMEFGVVFDRFGNQVSLSREEIIRLADSLAGVGDRITDFGTRFQGVEAAVDGAAMAMGGLVTSFSEVTQASLAAEGLDALNKAAEEGLVDQEQYEETFRELATSLDISAAQQDASLKLASIKSDMNSGLLKTEEYIDALFSLQDALRFQTLGGSPGRGEDESTGTQQQHGGTFTVPQGFPNDSFPVRASSGERVSVDNSERSFFSNSSVNINNGQDIDAFEEMLRTIQ